MSMAELILADIGYPVYALLFTCSKRLLNYLAFNLDRNWWRYFKNGSCALYYTYLYCFFLL